MLICHRCAGFSEYVVLKHDFPGFSFDYLVCDEMLCDVLALAAPEGALGDKDCTIVGVGYADL